MMKKFLASLLLAVCLTMAGCHTMEGLGKDLHEAGEKLEKAFR